MRSSERREAILEAAQSEFALHGLHGASTNAVAERVGISQPYLFQLFGSKKALFLAVLERVFDGMLERLREAVEGRPREEVLPALGGAYARQLTDDREHLLAFAQFLASCSDDDVRAALRARYGELYRFVEEASGANPEAVRTVFAYAMLAAAAAAMRLDDLPEGWAERLMGFADAFELD